MVIQHDSAGKVSEFLLQVKAIELNPNTPFTWASGIKSPIYCDNRKALSYPRIRNFIRLELVKALESNFGKPDVIAGVATGGIPWGVLVAQDLGLPFIYVRAKAKEHGMSNMVEGVIEEGQSVIVIEDLISTGKSSLNAVDALRELDCVVKGMVSIFTYGFDESENNFNQSKCPLVSLSSYDNLLESALESNYIQEEQFDVLKKWREAPREWNP